MTGESQTPDSKVIDVTSPYYLGSGDQPGNLISHIILKGDNYISWSRALTLSLKARRKFGFVDGSISKPTDSTALLDWDTVNSMIVSWINRTLDPKIVSSIPFHDTARALWLYLEKRYCVANGPRLQQLRAQITDCRQLKSMTVEDYYTKLMGLYDELDRLKPLHHCSCGKCTCGVVEKFCLDRDEEKLHQFYIGIDDDNYGAVRTNLLSQTPSPDLDRAYQTFLQEERSRAIARTKSVDTDTHAFALSNDRSRSRPRSNDVDKSSLVCSYCKKRGHERNTCFELHGKPLWWYERYGTAKGSQSSSATAMSKNRGAQANALTSVGDGLLPLPMSASQHGPTAPHVPAFVNGSSGPPIPGPYVNGQAASNHVGAGPTAVSFPHTFPVVEPNVDGPIDNHGSNDSLQPSVRLEPSAASSDISTRPSEQHHSSAPHETASGPSEALSPTSTDSGPLLSSYSDQAHTHNFPTSSNLGSSSSDQAIPNNTTTSNLDSQATQLPEMSPPLNAATSIDDIGPQPETLGRGQRVKRPSVLLRDYVIKSITTHTPTEKGSSSHAPDSDSSSGTPYPIAHYVNCDNFSMPHRAFLSAVLSGNEPRSFREAMQDEGWREAMQKEIRALEDNNTWEMTDLPTGKKALGSRWVYKVKYNADGTVERLKARLVILGNHQVEGVDYTETFAPVAKMVTVRAFLAVAAAKNWELHQMDVHNAFLHGDLTEEVYMKPPPGFSSRGKVCRLLKSLYGLKQAPRCWFAKLSTSLKQYGFHQSYSDYSLFTYRNGSVQLNVLVYVDDLIISGNDSSALTTFKQYLCTCFHMKDLGRLKYFLGIEVARSAEGILLCQRKYALDIITETGLLGAKPASFPIEQNHSLALARGDLLTDPERYRRLVGRLIYLSFTRPDLAYAVHILAQFMQAPRVEHWDAALRVVRYLKGSPGQGILLPSQCELRLTGWCDSDWASCPLTRRSLTGWIVFLGGSPISWKTKKQHTVSRSSAEAEYRSMASVTCELKWLRGLLSSLGVEHSDSMLLYCDSKSALHIAQNPVFHERTKHIEVDCHYIRDAIQEGLLSTHHVSTNEQLADIFTKALGHRQFHFLLRKLGIYDPHAPT
ncbi:Retrovirus-related Pol polyprotein from transposon RE2 [Bienertia sinuspersici]